MGWWLQGQDPPASLPTKPNGQVAPRARRVGRERPTQEPGKAMRGAQQISNKNKGKQKPKATIEEANKSQQALGMSK